MHGLRARPGGVLERIGMSRDPADDFDHPNVTNERIRPHVLYRLARG
jgi:ribosomal-protein-alanine N-acetyltransferase